MCSRRESAFQGTKGDKPVGIRLAPLPRMRLTTLLVCLATCFGACADDPTPNPAGATTGPGPGGDGGATRDDAGTDGRRNDSGDAGGPGGDARTGGGDLDSGPGNFGPWKAPIGVPAPSFGLDESAPAMPNPWNAVVSGWYYVCPSCAGATDNSNPNGYPAKARQTIPSPLGAGSTVIVSGQVDTDESFTGNGSASAPIFIRGVDYPSRPKLTGAQTVSGSYVILENIHWGPANAADGDFGVSVYEGNHHIAIRDCELSGNLNRSGGIGLGSWDYGGSQSLSNVVVNNCSVHDIGDVAASNDQDAHCITVNGSVDHLWVTYNTLARCSGDGMQVEAQQGRRDKIHHVYFAKNTSHHHRQTGAWIKHATDVIFSQNVMHDFSPNSGGSGAGTGFQYGPEQVWLLFNETYNAPAGIAMVSNDPPGDGLYQYAIGNVIHDIHGPANANPYDQGAIIVRGGTHVSLVNNTIDRFDSGINVLPGMDNVSIVNNIVSNRAVSGSDDNDLYVEGSTVVLGANLFFNSSGYRFNLNGSTSTSPPGQCQGCTTGDPLFLNSSAADYRLQAGSAAINAGASSDVYAAFQTRYGISIAVDADGKSRPAGAWDVGAYQH